MPAGRPPKQFDTAQFADLVGLGCTQEEICWFFRDRETGKPANPDTLSRWCKREYGLNFQEYSAKMGTMALKIQLRRNQLALSRKSAAMAIFLGKQYLGQRDNPDEEERKARLDALRARANISGADDAGDAVTIVDDTESDYEDD